MGGAGFPPCWLFGLRQPNTGAYLGSLVGLMTDFERATPRSTSENFCCQCPCPNGETEPPPPPLQETYQHKQVGLVQSPLGSLLLPLGPNAHTILCAPSKSGVSVSPSPVEVLQSIPTRLRSLILYEFLLLLPEPQVGKPDTGLRNFTPVSGLL